MICRDESGKLLTATSKGIFAYTPLMAEALGLREAVSLARSLHIPKAIFESDNQIIIEACRGNTERGDIEPIVQEIQRMRSEFESCGITLTKREGNIAAHTIASLAHKKKLMGDWIRKPPEDLREAIVKDKQALWR